MLAGALPGTLPVTFAKNNKAPTPDVVCVTEIGAFSVSSSQVTSYPDTTLTDKTTIEMSCYVEGGRPTVVVKGRASPGINATSGYWNERQSPTLSRWRCSRSVFFQNKWLLRRHADEPDPASLGGGFRRARRLLHGAARKRAGEAISEPASLHGRLFRFTSGQGTIGGTQDSMNPSVSISSSIDGGGTWSTPVLRRDLGAQGEFQR